MDRETHWDEIYRARTPDRSSWHAPHLERSLAMIRSVTDLSAEIIDVGGGASTLVDDLLGLGYSRISVLDVLAAALAIAQGRLGGRAEAVTWIANDVTSAELPTARYDVWHDRAVFHFLTDAADRGAYVERASKSIKPGGHLILATFAPDGPTRCSGLDIVRYSAADLGRELGGEFALVQEHRESHLTPAGNEQAFVYCSFRRV